jgi:hypothetical protein
MEKAAEKRKRREARKDGVDDAEAAPEEETLDPNDPYYLAKWFERQASQ